MQNGVKLKSVSLTKIFAIILIIVIIFLTIFFIAYKLISNAESIGVDYVHSFIDSAEKVINKHATILESGASNLSYFMKKNYSDKDIQEWMNNYIDYIENTIGTNGIDVFGVVNGKLISGQGRLDNVTKPINEMKFYVEAVKNKGKVFHSEVYTDIVNGEKVFTLSIALNNGKDVLAIDIFPKQLGTRWFLNTKLPEDTSYFLTDSKGEIILLASSINQPKANFEAAMKKTVSKIYSGDNEYNSAYKYVIDLEGRKRSLFYNFTHNNMVVVLTIPHTVLYKQSFNIVKNDIVSFIIRYKEMFLGFLGICIIVFIQVFHLNKMVKYQNQSIQALGNSYVAIFRVNLKTRKYVSIKHSDFHYNIILSSGDYASLISSFNTIMDSDTKKEFNKHFSIDNIRKLSKGEIHEFGGDFKWEVNGKSSWMNVTVLFDSFLSKDDALICFRNVDNERKKQLENMKLLASNVNTMQKDIKFNKQFYSNISHDMRTPINGIFGLIKLLKLNIDNKEKVVEYSDKLQVSANLLKSLVDDIVEQLNTEGNALEQDVVEFNIHKDIDRILDVFKIQADTEHKSFNVYYDVEIENILGDYNKLCHIINNLLSNAFKYTHEKDKIEFIVKQLSSGAAPKFQFIVKDTGVGMSQSFLARIYEPFAREKMFNDKKVQGTGLGMAIVFDRVKSMSGDINIESAIGEGTIVTITLPFTVPVYENQENFISENDYNEKMLENITVLVVDDDKVNMEVLSELFKLKHINVLKAFNGEEAVEIFKNSKEHSIDVILMDMQMPVMGGCDAAVNIRNLNRNDAATVPIIALTANAFAEDIQATSKAGMDAHVTKPVNYNILFRTIYQFIIEKITQNN